MLQLAATLVTIALLVGFSLLVFSLQIRTAKSMWLCVFTLVIAGGVTMMVSRSFIARWGIRTDSPRDGLWAMMDGTAARPFVFRRLAPDLVTIATDFSESHVPPNQLDAFMDASMLDGERASMTRRQRLSLHVAYTMVWSTLFLAVVASAALLRAARGCSWFEGLVNACLAISLIPLPLSNGG